MVRYFKKTIHIEIIRVKYRYYFKKRFFHIQKSGCSRNDEGRYIINLTFNKKQGVSNYDYNWKAIRCG